METFTFRENRISELDDNLRRSNFSKRAVILQHIYIEVKENIQNKNIKDIDHILELLNLLLKWGKTTEQRFDDLAGKLMLDLTSTLFDATKSLPNLLVMI